MRNTNERRLNFRWRKWLSLAGMAWLIAVPLGCERDRWDHKPPSGQGSIIVDNRTSDGVYVYLDGYYTNRVANFDYETYDLAPVIRRVVLDQSNGRRSWRGDVDVIAGKLTIVEVSGESGASGYDVRIYFD